MLNIFKQLWRPTNYAPQSSPLTLTTVNEWLKPVSRDLFEDSDALLETASEWLLEQGIAARIQHTGHFCLDNDIPSKLREQKLLSGLIKQIEQHRLPLLLCNQHEVILRALPYFSQQYSDVGIVNINLNLLMDPCVDVSANSMIHFALTRHQQCRAFHIGVDVASNSFANFEYAEDMGCDWLTLEEVTHRNKAMIKDQLSRFISHCDKLVVTIDLASIANVNDRVLKQKIDASLVFKLLRQCLASQKVLTIQLVGSNEQDIYSRTTQRLVQETTIHHRHSASLQAVS
ncbi:arginase family protein [Vibrio hippocampi]|uniref:Formimidoylglutamase n=1 Tax=Vibrio hippocampi TaxID=654686 RepID=A0ABM8ZLX2_9VIBR|nr:arginase family protein [Vibrio hippocampi]CAH0528927.1 Formimidoylglutamase [Vibrio hippocampi]